MAMATQARRRIVEDQNYQFGIGGANGGNALTPWGLQYSLTTTLDKSTVRNFDSNGLPEAPFTQDTATAGLSLVQPLLKNFWIDSTRASILVAKKTIQYDEFGFLHRRHDQHQRHRAGLLRIELRL